jgi:hypothetical protein
MKRFYYKNYASVSTNESVFVVKKKGTESIRIYRTFGTLATSLLYEL